MTSAERRKIDSPRTGRSARLVAAGILLSRIAGLVRERVFAHYFGTSPFADVFRAALRMPNVLQNLLGEGTLSASFIPVYSELLGQGRDEDAGRVAGAMFAVLAAVAGALALFGVVAAPVLVAVFLPGFEGLRRELAVTTIRILFPMTGVLVLSAWALGILNSHRRFFLAYVAPVLWNVAMIATMFVFGARLAGRELTIALSWGALAGGALQFLVQLPAVRRLTPGLRVRWDTALPGVRTALRNAGPAILGRGVVQLSGWIDMILASLLATGAVAALGYAQTLYMLPVSLFGMSVAAAELPELARGRGEGAELLRARLGSALRRIRFLVIPSAAGYLVLGDAIVAALYQTGSFVRGDTLLVYFVLAGYTVGLLASTGSRLLASAFFALHDTKTPARIAAVRVAIAAAAGYALMQRFDARHVDGRALGAVGLSLAAGIAAWIEWVLLRRALDARLGGSNPERGPVLRIAAAAFAGAACGRGVLALLPEMHPILAAAFALGAFGAVYLGAGLALGLQEAADLAARMRRALARGR